MTSFTIEAMLANTIEELEMAHAVMFQQFMVCKQALLDLSEVSDGDREDFLNGMTDLAYARRKLGWVRAKAKEALMEVDFNNES